MKSTYNMNKRSKPLSYLVASTVIVGLTSALFGLSSNIQAQSSQPTPPPLGTAYYTDTQSTWIDDIVADPISLPSGLLCLITDARAFDMTNQGQYLALVNGDACLGGGADGGTAQGESTPTDLWPMVLTSQRASMSSPQIVKGHIKVKPSENPDSTASFYVEVSEGPSPANPNGVMEFSLLYRGSGEQFRITFKADATGVALKALDKNPTDYLTDSEIDILGFFSTESETEGIGFIQTTSTDSAVRSDLLGTWVYGFVDETLCRFRADTNFNRIQGQNNDLCFSRKVSEGWQSSWDYRFYEADGSRFNPLKTGQRAAFDIITEDGSRGWMNQEGLWMPRDRSTFLRNGSTVTDARGNSYTLVRNGGVMERIERESNLPIAQLADVPIWSWNRADVTFNDGRATSIDLNQNGMTEVQLEYVWDGTKYVIKRAALPQVERGNPDKILSSELVSKINGLKEFTPEQLALLNQTLFGWLPRNHSAVQIDLTASPQTYNLDRRVKLDPSKVSGEVKLVCDTNSWQGCFTPTSLATLGTNNEQPAEKNTNREIEYTFKTGLDYGLYLNGERVEWPSNLTDYKGNFINGTDIELIVKDDPDQRYFYRVGSRNWSHTFALLPSGSKSFVNFGDPIFVKYSVVDAAANEPGYHDGEVIELPVKGNQIDIPGFCFDRNTNRPLDLCEGDHGWAHDFYIPFGSNGYVTYNDGTGDRTLWVKWIDRDLVFGRKPNVFFDSLNIPNVDAQVQSFVQKARSVVVQKTDEPGSAQYAGVFPADSVWRQAPKVIQGQIQ